LTHLLLTGELFSSASHALSVLDSAFSPAFCNNDLSFDIHSSNLSHIRSQISRLLTHYENILNFNITNLHNRDSTLFTSSFYYSISKVISNLSRKFKISQVSVLFVDQILRNLCKPFFPPSSISHLNPCSKFLPFKPSISHVRPLMDLKPKWLGKSPPSLYLNTVGSVALKSHWVEKNSSITTLRNPSQNTSAKKSTSKQSHCTTLPVLPNNTLPIDHSITPASIICSFAMTCDNATLPTAAVSVSLFHVATSSDCLTPTTSSSDYLQISSNSLKTPLVERFFTPPSSVTLTTTSKPTTTPQRQLKRFFNSSKLQSRPDSATTLVTVTEDPLPSVVQTSEASSSAVTTPPLHPAKRCCSVPSNLNKPHIFLRHKNSTTHWNLPPLTKKIVFIGDSNIANFKNSPENTQILSFSGANIDSIRSLVTEYKHNNFQPDKIIFSVGINNRNQNPSSSSIPSAKALISKTKFIFPKAGIYLVSIIIEKSNLSILNNSFTNFKNCSIIPPIPKHDFFTSSDNIHWTPYTTESILNHWLFHLKV